MISRLSILLLTLLLLTPVTLYAGKLAPRELSELFDTSEFVLIGKVTRVSLIQDRGLNGEEYELEMQILTAMKGSVTIERIKILTYIGGVKGFDFLLKQNQKGIFFMRSIEKDRGRLTHWGSVALFDDKYFK